MLDSKHKLILEDKLSSAFGKTWAAKGDEQKEVDKFVKIVMECCEVENLVSPSCFKFEPDCNQALT